MSRRGFSLVELLVVIGIIACLIGILLPALAAAREHAKRIACVSNVHQLTVAWLMYASEHHGRLCSSASWANDGTNSPEGQPVAKSFSWIGDGSDPSQGLLWPYLKDKRVYYCPEQPLPRYYTHYYSPGSWVSYAMNGNLAAAFESYGVPFRITQIKHAERTLVFIEPFYTVPATRYMPAFYSSAHQYVGFDSPPGCNHWLGQSNGTPVSFADGHAIFWQYSSQTTYNPFDYFGAYNSIDALQLAAWSGGQVPPNATP